MNNTIVAKNTAVTNTEISGNVTTSFYNLIGDGTGNNVINGDNGNIVGVDPLIGDLADNDGPTKTIALLLGSPAIDSGSTTLIPSNTDYDQRQSPYLRISGSSIDIGAFERQQQPVCYAGSSEILTKSLLTNNIDITRADKILSNKHQVYDTVNNKFIDVKLKAVTGKVTKFCLLKKNCLGFNKPSKDFYVTEGHKLLIDGKLVKARDISNVIKTELEPQPVYSICTDYQTPILINGLNVLTWCYSDFLTYCKKRVTDFNDN